ncbi:hypothetical protein PUT24_00180, partial [Streptomyces sp. SP17KL33]|nr:hypothetical protein [Streptomyces sp. SP17KL33]
PTEIYSPVDTLSRLVALPILASPSQKLFGGSSDVIPGIGVFGYFGLSAFVLNVVVRVVLTFVLRAAMAPEGMELTWPVYYRGLGGDGGVMF